MKKKAQIVFEIVFGEKEFLFCLPTECYVLKIHLATKNSINMPRGRQ